MREVSLYSQAALSSARSMIHPLSRPRLPSTRRERHIDDRLRALRPRVRADSRFLSWTRGRDAGGGDGVTVLFLAWSGALLASAY